MRYGTLDLLIAQRLGFWRTPLNFAVFNLAYTGVAAAVVALWLVAPVPSLVAFLLISAAHFSSDWIRGRSLALRFVTGAALLSLPSLRDQDAVADLYATLAGEGARAVAGAQAADVLLRLLLYAPQPAAPARRLSQRARPRRPPHGTHRRALNARPPVDGRGAPLGDGQHGIPY